jgi:cell fate regulator YaaT (PSP1 superfamily)
MSCGGCSARGSFNESDTITLGGCNKLNTHDWLSDLPVSSDQTDVVEIRFKNTRKDFFKNVNELTLKRGDIVAVEANPGHDIGVVSLTGRLSELQMKKLNLDPNHYNFKKVYRKAKDVDIDKWKSAQEKEKPTMIRARQIAKDLGLDMKIGDVEFQGDKTKAIFYYIADGRVDFRELIKVYAREFSVRIEMKQIGARQEAGLIGGIGSCGRELCCSSWRTQFSSVTTDAIRYQELPVNAQKLAGQCGKLKCCLMYELDTYLDAREDFPGELLELETTAGIAFHHKTDVLKKEIWYSFDKEAPVNLTPVPLERVKEVIMLNKKGQKVDKLIEDSIVSDNFYSGGNGEEADRIDRFDNKKPNNDKSRRKKPRKKRNFKKKFRNNKNKDKN